MCPSWGRDVLMLPPPSGGCGKSSIGDRLSCGEAARFPRQGRFSYSPRICGRRRHAISWNARKARRKHGIEAPPLAKHL